MMLAAGPGQKVVITADGEDEAEAVQALGELQQCGVGEVVALMDQNVAQPEAEAQFGNEFEVGEIDVTACCKFDVAVQRLGAQGHVLACGEVYGRCRTYGEIRSEVVVARSGNLQGYGHREIGGFQVLCGVTA